MDNSLLSSVHVMLLIYWLMECGEPVNLENATCTAFSPDICAAFSMDYVPVPNFQIYVLCCEKFLWTLVLLVLWLVLS